MEMTFSVYRGQVCYASGLSIKEAETFVADKDDSYEICPDDGAVVE